MKRFRLETLELAAARRPSGYKDDVLSHGVVVDGWVEISDESHAALREKYAPSAGPGTELKKLLALFGIHPDGDCPCNKYATQMNLWGPDECIARIDEICGWLQDAARERGLPFAAPLARTLVRRAVRNARVSFKPMS